jgi:hypothetical protein
MNASAEAAPWAARFKSAPIRAVTIAGLFAKAPVEVDDDVLGDATKAKAAVPGVVVQGA